MDKSEYLLIKTNKQMLVSYVNWPTMKLVNADETEVLGKSVEQILPIGLSETFKKFSQDTFSKVGFYNGYIKFNVGSRGAQWFFVDMGKRYSPSGEWLGFEYLAYQATDQGIHQFSQLDEELHNLEKEKSSDEAKQYLDNFIQSLGCSYDEFVCGLQAI